MKIHETKKLFYGEFLYKLEIRNILSNCFREKNLSLARGTLDTLQRRYEHNEPLHLSRGLRRYSIPEDEYFDAIKLYGFFCGTKEDYKLRVHVNCMNIYSNNLKWLENISKQLIKSNVISLHKPDDSVLDLLDKNTIIVKEDNGYQYKVTFGNKMGEPSFANWAESNTKQAKVGPICLDTHKQAGYVDGMYFYARDEKTLQLCHLITTNIRRIDKLVVKSNLDK